MEAIYRYQTQLNYVDDGLFPLLSHHRVLAEVEQKNRSFLCLEKGFVYVGDQSSRDSGECWLWFHEHTYSHTTYSWTGSFEIGRSTATELYRFASGQ